MAGFSNLFSAITLAIFLFYTVTAKDYAAVYDVYHNLESSNEFIQRGELLIQQNGTAEYQSVSVNQPQKLEEVDEKMQDSSYYTVVVRNQQKQYVLPVKRCRLLGQTKIEEVFILHESTAAGNDGQVFHVDYDVGKSTNCQLSTGEKQQVSSVFSTKAYLKKQVRGPLPKLAPAAVIDMSTGKEKEPEPQKSFLAKYWYYIVPVVLLLLVGGEDPQQQQGGQQGGGNARKG